MKSPFDAFDAFEGLHCRLNKLHVPLYLRAWQMYIVWQIHVRARIQRVSLFMYFTC